MSQPPALSNGEQTDQHELSRGSEEIALAKLRYKSLQVGERHKTIRLGILCTAVVLGLGILGWTVVHYTQPAWVTAFNTVFGATAGTSGIIAVLMKVYNRHLKKEHRRIVELEQRLDPQRTSSLPPGSEDE